MELTDRKITSLNVEETQRIAAALAEVVVPGTVIASKAIWVQGKRTSPKGLRADLALAKRSRRPRST